MNISLKQEYFKLTGVGEKGDYFVIEDEIGFATQDGIPGFNPSNAGEVDVDTGNTVPEYVDTVGNPFPKPEEAALLLLPYLNLYKQSDYRITKQLTPILRSPLNVSTADSMIDEYKEISYKSEVSINGDGWYTVYAFLLDVFDSSSGDPVPTEGVYYDKTNSVIRKVIEGEAVEIKIDDLLNEVGISSIDLHFFITPGSEKRLNAKVSEVTDLGITKGACHDDYLKARKDAFFIEGQLSGARIKFFDGYKSKAQMIIENLEATEDGEC